MENQKAIEATPQLPDDCVYWPIETLASGVVHMGRNAIYQAIKNDGFPAPYKFGGRRSLWKKTEVLEWMRTRPQGVSGWSVTKGKVA
ncbi:AlpA family transcriptional regulator [Snodgrassella sp. CFCC 13594]|uniref:helix-turn-helix transcriptional regulator n=1 Tax=Snodgrassella sp. CFCC 13594 TaxID=1775559 RepID=UPI00082B12C2|nr:AlpA family phage regulatory protein [Snodgrassella sp. CFCC 13594]